MGGRHEPDRFSPLSADRVGLNAPPDRVFSQALAPAASRRLSGGDYVWRGRNDHSAAGPQLARIESLATLRVTTLRMRTGSLES